MNREMQRALEADGEKLRHLTGEDHGPAPFDEFAATILQKIASSYAIPYDVLMAPPAEPFQRFCWTCHGMQRHENGKVTPPAKCVHPEKCADSSQREHESF